MRARPEPWTVEGFEIQDAVDHARRLVTWGLRLAPIVAAIWAATAARAHGIEAGRVDVAHALGDARRAEGMIINVLWLAVYVKFGMRGLHVAFGALVAVPLCLALFGWAKQRRLNARYGRDTIDALDRARWRMEMRRVVDGEPSLAALAEKPPVQEEPARTIAPRLTRAEAVLRHPFVFAVYGAFVMWPFAAILLTLTFAWMALKP